MGRIFRIDSGMNISNEDEETILSLLGIDQWRHIRLFKAKRGKAALSVEIYEVQLP